MGESQAYLARESQRWRTLKADLTEQHAVMEAGSWHLDGVVTGVVSGKGEDVPERWPSRPDRLRCIDEGEHVETETVLLAQVKVWWKRSFRSVQRWSRGVPCVAVERFVAVFFLLLVLLCF